MNISIQGKTEIITSASRESKIKQTKREYQAQSNSPHLKSSIKLNNNKKQFLNISINPQENSHSVSIFTPTNYNNNLQIMMGNTGIKEIDKLGNQQKTLFQEIYIKKTQLQEQQDNLKEQQKYLDQNFRKPSEQNFRQPHQTPEVNQEIKIHFHSLSPSTILQQNCDQLLTNRFKHQDPYKQKNVRIQNQDPYKLIQDNFIDQTDKLLQKVRERKILNDRCDTQQDFHHQQKQTIFNYDQLEFKIDLQKKQSEKNNQYQNILQEKQNQQNILQEKQTNENIDLIYKQSLKRSDSFFNKLQFHKKNNIFISNLKDQQIIQNKENIIDNASKNDLNLNTLKTYLNNTEIQKSQIFSHPQQTQREETERNMIGQLENQDKEIFKEPFDYQNFNNLGQKWDKFIGLNYENSYLRGVLFLTNGEKWEGLFKNGLLNGEGIFTQLYGNQIKGTWMNDKYVQLN